MKRAVKFQATRLQACVVLHVGYHASNYAQTREFDAWREAFACKAPDIYQLGRCLAAVPYEYPVKSEERYNAIREEYATNLTYPVGEYPVAWHWVEARAYRVGYVAAVFGVDQTDVLRRLRRSGEWLPATSVEAEFGELPVLNEDANLWYNIRDRLTSGSADFDNRTMDVILERATRVRRERRAFLNEMVRKF